MNIKKILIGIGVIVVLGLAVIVGVTLFSGDDSATVEQALGDGVLTVAIIPSDDMYCYALDGGYGGVEPMMAEAMASTASVNCALVAYETKSEAMAALSSREVDLVLARMDTTDSRISGFTTSVSYGTGSLYLVTPKSTYLNALSLLADQVVVISSDVTMDMQLGIENYGLVTPMTVTEQDDYVFLLEEGVASAVLCSEWEAVSLALSGAEVQVQPLINSPTESYVAVMQGGETSLFTVANLVVNAYLDGFFDS